MPGGRPAQPAALKLIKGRGDGKDSAGREVKQVAFKRLPPEPPIELGPLARAQWDKVVSELSRLDILKSVDGPSLAAYCLTWQRFTEAQEQIEEYGLTAATSQGVGVAPWVRVADAASKELRAWAREFGLTPSGEANIAGKSSDGDEDSNPF